MNAFISRLQNEFADLKKSPQLWVGLVSVILGLLCLSLSIFLILKPKHSDAFETSIPLIKVSEEDNPVLASKSGVTTEVVVNVAGSVKKPGLYTLNDGARIFNALEAAGGLSKDADSVFIQQQINLADKVKEGEKIYFPPIQKETDTSPKQLSQLSDTDNLISINSASADELNTLPGIGDKLAAKIIDGRPYENIEELNSRINIGASVYAKIKEQIKL